MDKIKYNLHFHLVSMITCIMRKMFRKCLILISSFFLLECRKRKTRLHEEMVITSANSVQIIGLILRLIIFQNHGRHSMLSFLSALPISVLRSLDTESNKFYESTNQLNDAALLSRCYN